MRPDLIFVAHLSVTVGEPIDLGEVVDGHRRIVPILGGTVEGPLLRGRVLPGGADHQILRTPTITELDARYALETDAGERVAVHNMGIRSGAEEDIDALVRGEDVPADRVYFRSQPRLSSAASRLAWMNERLFLGSGKRLPNSIELDIYQIT
ncbi:hypothetical protein CH306_08850 [Rhodococcus sp. 15-725-2-2b]|uniref:DUF3237 domain-containing protein n=1 Tax=unclassified Rhodococcus (in: high G+C Gram-positive bacteria) TaxID=192944 RepID=UPI000B9C3448|nr:MULTISPECIES: DUF3237 domain-containing protein [unclassified Rhodococcus (in: high G+C Gram-positive bacteria)]OZC69280.1 hypothetical protein CH277_08945 [Rhodococcus sp. 06-469-3-2]OZD45708.1 hypothetical protein CH264_15700 [Rhodococcus sp. 06-1477-1A]OZE12398.1 hypothetical protein CH250_08985 [Rhodococcus sp. 05-2255-3C]OZE13993.1 hypothetical protein CH249_05900 [Rhodococcus sp. 05-2255-3B1]OZE19761.1 hypothetical protein CH255_10920 [Rhodococcus sp. 05-2255-2A2]